MLCTKTKVSLDFQRCARTACALGTSLVMILFVGACMNGHDDATGSTRANLDPPLELPADAFDGAIVASQEVGQTPAAFRVADDGEAIYSIPLVVPDGRLGMQPDLSIGYGSRGGNGLLGLGWGVSGFSVITRCPKTLAVAGTTDGIKFDDSDWLCMDGQPLVQVGGDVYGAPGAEYRRSRNGFERITQSGAFSDTASHFEVHFRDGRIATYGDPLGDPTGYIRSPRLGEGPDGTVAPAETVTYGWLLTKLEDRAGNYLTYQYQNEVHEEDSSFEYWPTQIRYTGHGIDPGERHVDFLYESDSTGIAIPRPDPILQYIAGLPLKTTRRLAKIEMHAPSVPSITREYRFHYDVSASTYRSLLASVWECDGFGGCKPPISFDWHFGGFGAGEPQPTGIGVDVWWFEEQQPTVQLRADYALTPLDVDGDGTRGPARLEVGSFDALQQARLQCRASPSRRVLFPA